MSNITADFDNMFNWVGEGGNANPNQNNSSMSLDPKKFTAEKFHEQQVKQFKKNLNLGNKDYLIHLRVKKKCESGQSIVILGGIPHLGAWNTDQPRKMKWTEGDFWVTDEPI